MNHDDYDDRDDSIDLSRRLATTGLFAAAGAAALGACVETGGEGELGTSTSVSALTGTLFNWVDTMANLRGIPHVTNAPIVVLEGWTIASDGGGGVFCWDAASRQNDNNGTIIRPSNVLPTGQGRWKRLYSGPLNVRWFGAGLGATNDQPAIQAVIDLVAAQGGGTVFLPAGTYNLEAPLLIAAHNIRIVGEGQNATVFRKRAPSSTVFELRGASYCEISDVGFGVMEGGFTTEGAAILLTGADDKYWMRPLIQRIHIDRMWMGIACGPGLNAENMVHDAVIRDVKMDSILFCGMKLVYALNWHVSTCMVGMIFDDVWNGPGSGHYGMWLDTDVEGCVFDTVFVLHGEHCWRIANSIEPAIRGPSENRFHSCIADNGMVSCIYISSLHRGIFSNCWASTQKATSDAAVVMDSMDVWGVEWISSQIVFTRGHGIKVLAATSFSVVSSSFSEWNVEPTFGVFSAILVYPGLGSRTNFQITGNQFTRDVDFFQTPHLNQRTITVMPGTYNRYIITHNLSYAGTTTANLGSGGLDPVSDAGTAAAKIVNSNL